MHKVLKTSIKSLLIWLMNNIDANWDGSAFDSFEAQFNELSPKIKQFAQLLEDINAQLIKVADIVEQTDQDIAAQIR